MNNEFIQYLLSIVDINKADPTEKEDFINGCYLIKDEGLSDKSKRSFKRRIDKGESPEHIIACYYRNDRTVKFLSKMIKQYGDNVLEKLEYEKEKRRT